MTRYRSTWAWWFPRKTLLKLLGRARLVILARWWNYWLAENYYILKVDFGVDWKLLKCPFIWHEAWPGLMKSDLYVRVMIYGSFEDSSLLTYRLFTCGTKMSCLMPGLILAKLCCLLDEFVILYFDFTVESNSKAFDVRSEHSGSLYVYQNNGQNVEMIESWPW